LPKQDSGIVLVALVVLFKSGEAAEQDIIMVELDYTAQSIMAAWLLNVWMLLVGIASQYVAIHRKSRWLVRYLSVVLLFIPVLGAGAYEIYWLLISSVTLGASLISGIRRFVLDRDGFQDKNKASVKFSLGSILIVTALLAGATTIALHTPTLNFRAWVSLTLVCLATSILSAIAYYVNQVTSIRLTLVASAASIAMLIAVPLSLMDWLLLSLHMDSGWPPDLTLFTLGLPGVAPPNLHPEWLWFGVTPLALLCLTFGASAWREVRPIPRGLIAFGLLAFALPPMILSLQLLFTPEIPADDLPDNAYGQVSSLSARVADLNLQAALTRFGDWEAIPAARMSKILNVIGGDLDTLSKELQRPVRAPVDFSIDNLPMDDLQNFRTTAKAFVARGRLRAGTAAAATDCLSAVQLGVRSGRDGLSVQDLVGKACSSLGLRELYDQRLSFDDGSRKRISQQLLALSEEIEPVARILKNERTFMVRQGWHSHLTVLLAEWSGRPLVSVDTDFMRQQSLQHKTLMHLLATDLAIQAFQRQNGQPPDTLVELVPNWLPRVPQDALAIDEGPLKYKVVHGQYELYSVGTNGIDENGAITEKLTGFMPTDGDFRLEGFFAN
jgi:hypothetical protein